MKYIVTGATRQSTIATGRCPEAALTRKDSSTPAPGKRAAGLVELKATRVQSQIGRGGGGTSPSEPTFSTITKNKLVRCPVNF